MHARTLNRTVLFLSVLLSIGSTALAQTSEPQLLAEIWRIGDTCPLEFGSPAIPGCSTGSPTSTEIAIDIRERPSVDAHWLIEGIDQNSVGQTFILGKDDPRFASFVQAWINGGDPYETEYDFRLAAGGIGISEVQLRTIDDRDLKTTYFAEPLSSQYDLAGYVIDYFSVTVGNIASAQFEEYGWTFTEWAGRYVLRVWGRRDPSVNHPPVVVLDPHTGQEGAAIDVTGLVSDQDTGDVLTFNWSIVPSATGDVDPGATCTVADENYMTAITCTDDGTYTLSFTASDGKSSSTASNTLNVSNVAPTVYFAAPADEALFAVNTTVSANILFEDPGTNDTHTCVVNCGDGMTGYDAPCSQGIDLYGVSHTYSEADVYTIAATVMDDDGGLGYAEKMVVVYDPSAGYVSGEGWILSPAGAYTAEPEMTGKASFGFVSKYRKGATVPDGNAVFVFQAGDLNFHSSAYDWLVVSGSSRAQFKGTGTINGFGSYGFMVSVTDAGTAAGNAVNDTFRIKIWDKSRGDAVIYDNAVEQAIGGGNIVIHTVSKK